ncbi:MAG TPA: hypothetical protein VN317_10760 [Candidatus Methanoperedens sp.]|nr:hypothetical protein [Candidatus Methanoperedens sp.]
MEDTPAGGLSLGPLGRLRTGEVLGGAAAIAGFLIISWYLGTIDVFTTDYAATGARMLFYQLARAAFLPYFAWLLAGAGWLCLLLLRR